MKNVKPCWIIYWKLFKYVCKKNSGSNFHEIKLLGATEMTLVWFVGLDGISTLVSTPNQFLCKYLVLFQTSQFSQEHSFDIKTVLFQSVQFSISTHFNCQKYLFQDFQFIFIIRGFWTIVFIFIVISTTFRPICPLAFFRCLSNSGIVTGLRNTSFIQSTEVDCSDSVSYNRVQVLSIPALWSGLNLQPLEGGLNACSVSVINTSRKGNLREPSPITVTLFVLLDKSEWILGLINFLTWLRLIPLCMIFFI